MDKYTYAGEQIQAVLNHLDNISLTGLDNAKRLGVVASILEKPIEIIEGGEASGSQNSTGNS